MREQKQFSKIFFNFLRSTYFPFDDAKDDNDYRVIDMYFIQM